MPELNESKCEARRQQGVLQRRTSQGVSDGDDRGNTTGGGDGLGGLFDAETTQTTGLPSPISRRVLTKNSLVKLPLLTYVASFFLPQTEHDSGLALRHL